MYRKAFEEREAPSQRPFGPLPALLAAYSQSSLGWAQVFSGRSEQRPPA
jgi:hypothetical protein